MNILSLDRVNATLTKWLNLYSLKYDHNGKVGYWYFAARKDPPVLAPSVDAVVVVCTVNTPEGKRLLVTSEFRPVIGTREFGFVAGLIDGDEKPEDAAKREVHEEAGLTVTKVVKVSPPIVSSAGLSNEAVIMVFVEAEGDVSNLHNEPGEDIHPFLLDFEGVCDLTNRRGKFEGVSIAAKAWPVLYMIEQLGKL